MRFFLFGFLGLLLSTSAPAQGLLYESVFDSYAANYLALLNQHPTDDWADAKDEKRAFCEHRYENLLEDGVLDIRISLGYFDWTEGLNINTYGRSPSIDLGAFVSLRKFLLSPCRGQAQFCGFKPEPKNLGTLSKSVQMNGRRYLAQIEMQFSSVTEFFDTNITRARDQQIARSESTERFYLDSLQSADVAFYFGHARDGGGPDFDPPVLNNKGRVDYDNYYIPKKIGLGRMLEALTQATHPAPVIGVFSCDSRDHFLKKLRLAAPDSGIITSMAVIDVKEGFTALIGATDALLRGQCNNFYKSMRLTDKNAKTITMDGMFE